MKDKTKLKVLVPLLRFYINSEPYYISNILYVQEMRVKIDGGLMSMPAAICYSLDGKPRSLGSSQNWR